MKLRLGLSSGVAAVAVAFAASAFAQVAAPSIAVQSQWRGLGLVEGIALGQGFIPPDMGGGAGPTHVVQFVNGLYATYTRDGQRVGKIRTGDAFWRAAGISAADTANGLSDPRIIYDAASGRFFVCMITIGFPSFDNPNGHNAILIAVSKTSDPTQGFRATKVQLKNGVLGDYPTLGVNGDAVTLSTNNFGLFGFQDLTVFSIPKADLLLAKPSAANVSRFDSLASSDSGVPGTVEALGTEAERSLRYTDDDAAKNAAIKMPGAKAATRPLSASGNGKGYGFAMQAVNSQGAANGSQELYAISNTFLRQFAYSKVVGAGQSLAGLSESNIIRTKYDGNPNPGRQPAGPAYPYDNGDQRIGAAIKQVGNYVYMANTIGDAKKNSVHFVIVDSTTHKVVVDHLITDPTGKMDYSFPSIDANASGQIVVGYNGSGVNTNISAFATACNFDSTALTVACSAPRLLYAGLNSDYSLGGTRIRWGDYSHTQVDPVDPKCFWVYLEINAEKQLNRFGVLRPRWGTVITKVVVQ